MKKKLLLDGIAALFILLWLYTGLSKYLDFSMFKFDILKQPFPKWLATIAIILIPPIEISVAILLLFKRTQKMGIYISSALILMFTVYTCIVLSGLLGSIPCSCGGIIRSLNWWQHLFFDLVFSLLAVIAVRLYKKKNKNQYKPYCAAA